MRTVFVKAQREAEFKLCHLTKGDEGRFPTRRYKCMDGRSCAARDIKNDYVDVMKVMLRVFKYIAFLCSPWILPFIVTVAKKKRFAVIGPHLWQKLDGRKT